MLNPAERWKEIAAAPEEEIDLAEAALVIAAQDCPGLDVGGYRARLTEMGMALKRRLRGDIGPADTLLALNRYVFAELEFRGNVEDYYDPCNSYLPLVLENRSGLPITLSLVYKAVADRLGLFVEGINSPGHFLARVDGEGEQLIVDAFDRGRILTREEAFARIEQVNNQPFPRDVSYLLPATHHQWIARILMNLQNSFANQGRQEDLAAMSELQACLAQTSRL